MDVAAIPVTCSYVGLPLETEFGITASELVVPPVRLDDLDVNVSILAASFTVESVVGFGSFVFHGIYLLMVEVIHRTRNSGYF